jgi:CHAT domain-containing protein
MQNVSGATHLHLACHASGGLLDYAEAELHLAGRSVKGAELETLPISTRLSVLSACQTAQLDMSNLPDEVSSMSTALLVAGSAAVVATQWPVQDRPAALLMSRFYEELIANDIDVGEALRRAQLWLRDSEPSGEFAHPLYWGPFVLSGA